MGQPIERECPEEAAAQVPNGPGVVLDGERIVRLVLRDEHLLADGRLAPSAVPTDDLLVPNRKGLSVSRLPHLTHEELNHIIIGEYKNRDERKLHGCGVVLTSGVRGLRDCDGRRIFCVVDDPRDRNESHALIRLADQARYNRGSVRRARKRLMDLMTLCTAEALRDAVR